MSESSTIHEQPLLSALDRYRHGAELTPNEVILVAKYLRHWIDEAKYDEDNFWMDRQDQQFLTVVRRLRFASRNFRSRRDIRRWLDLAHGIGLRPL